MSNPTGMKMINLWQTNTERQDKYWLGKSAGLNTALCRRLRDWPLSKIERLLGLDNKALSVSTGRRI